MFIVTSIFSLPDFEIKNIIDTCYEKCEKLLNDNREKLDNIAKALVDLEKLDGAEFEDVFQNGYTPKEETSTIEATPISEEEKTTEE